MDNALQYKIDGIVWMIGSAIIFLLLGLGINIITGNPFVILIAPLGGLIGAIIGVIRSINKDAKGEKNDK
jgi:hypothetical protein